MVTGLPWDGKREPFITAGDIPYKGGLGEGPPQHPIPGLFSLKANEHAVVVYGILIELAVFDAVVDNLWGNTTAFQV